MKKKFLNYEKLVTISILASTVLSGIGSIKAFLPPFSSWVLIMGALSITSLVGAEKIALGFRKMDIRLFLPWIFFIFGVVLSGIVNPASADLLLSASTVGKFIAMTIILALLLSMGPNVKQMEIFFSISMLVSITGFAISMWYWKWIMWYGDDRLAWIWAWAGVFWKTGAYALLFYIYRALQKPSWFDFPALALATTIIALDGSRTGLLVVVAVIAVAVCIKCVAWKSNRALFVCVCLASVIAAYFFIQPAILRTMKAGGFWTVMGFSGLCILSVSVYFQMHKKYHVSARLAVTAMIVLAGGYWGGAGW